MVADGGLLDFKRDGKQFVGAIHEEAEDSHAKDEEDLGSQKGCLTFRHSQESKCQHHLADGRCPETTYSPGERWIESRVDGLNVELVGKAGWGSYPVSARD